MRSLIRRVTLRVYVPLLHFLQALHNSIDMRYSLCHDLYAAIQVCCILFILARYPILLVSMLEYPIMLCHVECPLTDFEVEARSEVHVENFSDGTLHVCLGEIHQFPVCDRETASEKY